MIYVHITSVKKYLSRGRDVPGLSLNRAPDQTVPFSLASLRAVTGALRVDGSVSVLSIN